MRYQMSKAVLLASTLWFVGCGSDLDAPSTESVNGGEVVVDMDSATMREILLSKHTPGVTADSPVYGYKAYKIPYETTDEEGNTVKVSGLMVVPTEVPDAVKALGFSVVSDSHGTIFANYEAPTVAASMTNLPDGAPVIFSSLGAFVTLQADYIGYGDSIGHYHPFILKNSLANATVDFIKAAEAFAAVNDIPLNGQLFVTGYSEGGYAAMAAMQKLEAEGKPVSMAAPMAGPYILEDMMPGADGNLTRVGMAPAVLSSESIGVPSFMALVGYAYANAYDHNVTEMINEPYASKLPTLFDGSKTRAEIDPELTHQTTGDGGLFNADFVGEYLLAGNWFTEAMKENNVHKWAPQTPMKLIHCAGDDVIPIDFSYGAEGMMNYLGAASVEVVPVEASLQAAGKGDGTPMGHAECALPAYGIAAHIFADVRKATIGY